MTKLLPLYAICAVLLYCTERNSEYDLSIENYTYREKQFYGLLILITVAFSGLRTDYNDTAQYINTYNSIKSGLGTISSIDWSLGEYPGFVLMEHIFISLGLSAQSFIMLSSILSVGVPLWFIHKYSNNLALSVFFFFTMGYYGFAIAAIKQCCSIAIALVAVDQMIQKKYIRFALLVIVAMTFHPFSVLFFVAPFLEFRPWSSRTFLLFGLFAFLGLNLQTWLGTLLNFASIMGTEYDVALVSGSGVNPFRVAVLWAPVIFSIVTIKFWKAAEVTNTQNRVQNLMMNLTVLNAELMFVALFGNPIYFGRLANYFLLFQTISLPWLLQYFEERSKKIMTLVIVIAFLGYHYYDNVLASGAFDNSFQAMTLIQYLTRIRG